MRSEHPDGQKPEKTEQVQSSKAGTRWRVVRRPGCQRIRRGLRRDRSQVRRGLQATYGKFRLHSE